MTKAAMDASVIISTYSEKRWDDLRSAVASVQNQTTAPREIIVVADHNPALLARVRAEIPGVRAVENIEPRGAAGARNSGVSTATGNLVVFLDDDAIAAPDWLAQLAGGYTDSHVLGVGGLIEPLWESGRPRWFPEEFDWAVGCTYRGMPSVAGAIRNLIASNMSVRRQDYEQVGGFRKDTGPGGTSKIRCDETEFRIRMRQARPDDRFVYQPNALVRNRIPLDRSTFSYFCSRCYGEGVSKANLVLLLGARDGLSSERTYMLRALPRGVLSNLADVVRRRDPFAPARAAAIIAGLAFVTAGYFQGTVSHALGELFNRQVAQAITNSSANPDRIP